MARYLTIAGNWKMYKTIGETVEFIKILSDLTKGSQARIYLAVPFTAIQPGSSCAPENIIIGAQNMNDASEGAFTGEIAATMLKDAGAQFVILGHSERRHLFGESSNFIQRKLHRALSEGIQPIVCVGETLQQRKEGQTEEVLRQQLLQSLGEINSDQLVSLQIAYEPVWAIGTGVTASEDVAQKAHAFCRSVLSEKWGEAIAQQVTFLYGGSVKATNAAILLEQPDIDGLLVGGAALDPHSFSQIIHSKLAIGAL